MVWVIFNFFKTHVIIFNVNEVAYLSNSIKKNFWMFEEKNERNSPLCSFAQFLVGKSYFKLDAVINPNRAFRSQ